MTQGQRTADYEKRKIAKTWLKSKIGVSTVWAEDFSAYETALLDNNGTHPVERYETKRDAIKGHKKWVRFARTGVGKKVTELGTEDGLIDDSEVTLEPRE